MIVEIARIVERSGTNWLATKQYKRVTVLQGYGIPDSG